MARTPKAATKSADATRKTARRKAPVRAAPRTPAPAARGRLAAFGIGAAVVGGVAALVGIFAHRRDWMAAEAEGHAAPDLALDAPRPGTERAPEAFRPDPTAPVADADREALRPATGAPPSLMG